MTEKKYDVLGIGNAIVDVLAQVDDAFLESESLAKGGMALIDAERAASLSAAIAAERELSGGSVANTMVGLADLGGRAAFIGKVGTDSLGETFRMELNKTGVDFLTPDAQSGPPTAQCVVLVTPDAQRTMNTYLGACVHVGPEDVDAETVASASVIYLEGYLWDLEPAKEAFLKAAKMAHESNVRVSLSLSDPFCVNRHRESFLDFVKQHVDILFANEEEIRALYQSENIEDALESAASDAETVAVTLGADGAAVLHGGARHAIEAVPPRQLVDTTGAGDLFAAGFLYGYTQGFPLDRCGQLGAAAASEIIAQYGARSERSLREVAAPLLT
ncbi:MAG: adenosine kinase [Planctomycetota bacterium]|nr:adenosine kinase [Planctomycetota bacterium]